MTDEIQKLCTKLRDGSYLTWDDKCAVADEIERLAKYCRDLEETMRGLQIAFERGHNYD